jgi:hypothetical protein
MLEKKLDDELSHVRQLEDEKDRVERECTALEEAQRLLEAQKSQAELEKASCSLNGWVSLCTEKHSAAAAGTRCTPTGLRKGVELNRIVVGCMGLAALAG